jgi:alkylhydroperoxidase/carboxymuconolactone decarboxylase family protein YurZ
MSITISSSLRSSPLPGQVRAQDSEKVAETPIPDIDQEFLEIARKSPAERLRDKIMEDLKVTDQSLAAMDAEVRQGVEDEIKRRMMEALEASTDTGQLVDKSA